MAMDQDPSRRYLSAQHFEEDLLRYLQGRPVSSQKSIPNLSASEKLCQAPQDGCVDDLRDSRSGYLCYPLRLLVVASG